MGAIQEGEDSGGGLCMGRKKAQRLSPRFLGFSRLDSAIQ